MNIDAKLGLDVFKLDKEPHIVIHDDMCAARAAPTAPASTCARPTCTSSTTSSAWSSTGRAAWSAAPA